MLDGGYAAFKLFLTSQNISYKIPTCLVSMLVQNGHTLAHFTLILTQSCNFFWFILLAYHGKLALIL